MALWQRQFTPICQHCASPSEDASADKTKICAGCGLELVIPRLTGAEGLTPRDASKD